MLGAFPLASRPLVATPRQPRPFRVAALVGEYGWAAWSYSRQAKLNAWAWHGVGASGINSWATLGDRIYVRREGDSYVHVMQPDVFLAEGVTSTDSASVEATTQWLDFGKPGRLKALTGIDMDVLGVQTVQIYVHIPDATNPRSRVGTLAATLSLINAETGWTYNGELIPTEDVGAATEFMLRFVCDAKQESQINRISLYWQDLEG